MALLIGLSAHAVYLYCREMLLSTSISMWMGKELVPSTCGDLLGSRT